MSGRYPGWIWYNVVLTNWDEFTVYCRGQDYPLLFCIEIAYNKAYNIQQYYNKGKYVERDIVQSEANEANYISRSQK